MLQVSNIAINITPSTSQNSISIFFSISKAFPSNASEPQQSIECLRSGNDLKRSFIRSRGIDGIDIPGSCSPIFIVLICRHSIGLIICNRYTDAASRSDFADLTYRMLSGEIASVCTVGQFSGMFAFVYWNCSLWW